MDANSCFLELLLAVATVDMACRYCTLAVGGGNGVQEPVSLAPPFRESRMLPSLNTPLILQTTTTSRIIIYNMGSQEETIQQALDDVAT